MIQKTESSTQCFNCNRPETVIPLVSLRYAGRQAWICSQCLPTLIHQPEQLAHRLEEVQQAASARQED